MIKSVFHLLKIHRKVIFGNPSVIVKDVFGKRPESFNAVDMVLASVGERFAVVKAVMFAQPFEGVVAPEGVGVVDRTLPGFLPNNGHKFFFGDMLNDSGVNFAIPLQEAKNNVFAGCTPTTLAFSSAAKIAFIHLYLAVELTSLKLRHVVDRFAESLVDARNRLVVGAKIMRETVRRLLLVKPLDDGNLHPDSLQRFLFSTGLVATSDVPAACPRDLERTAENALLSSQKVGRAPENVLSPLCHMNILLPYGYETP